MLRYVNLVCLPFGAGQVVYSGFIRDFSLITAACCGNNPEDEKSERELKPKLWAIDGRQNKKNNS